MCLYHMSLHVIALINYMCLPTICDSSNNAFNGESVTLAGWGRLSDSKFSRQLQHLH